MADVLLFHHAQGLTDGVRAFAAELRHAGHDVSTPDLYGGAVFATLDEGVAHAENLGVENILDAGVAFARQLPAPVVYGGFSLGALIAHKLAQTRSGARGALLFHYGDVPLDAFGEQWPFGVPVQFHLSERDPWREAGIAERFVERVAAGAAAQLYEYPGSAHLFTDSSLAAYDAGSCALVLSRTLDFLGMP